MDIAYRTPRTDEAAAIAQLAFDTFEEAFGALYTPADLAIFYAENKTPEAFARWIASPRTPIQVAYDDEQAIGYAMIGFDRTLDYDCGPRKAIELKQLYVLAPYHGQGVAQSLMNWVIEVARAQAADDIVLSVYSGNPRGQAFYAKYGFAHVADTTFTVGEQVDPEYLYVKALT